MSSLIFDTEKDYAFVATDTLATSLDGTPSSFTSKAYFLPHLHCVMAVTGFAQLLSLWFVASNAMRVKGIEALDQAAPEMLRQLWKVVSYQPGFSTDKSTTIYHFGFSEVTGDIKSFAYRSADNFRSEELSYGISAKPALTPGHEGYYIPQDVPAMMIDQRSIQAKMPLADRVFIGGEIKLHFLTKAKCEISTLHRFDDYEGDAAIIFNNHGESK